MLKFTTQKLTLFLALAAIFATPLFFTPQAHADAPGIDAPTQLKDKIKDKNGDKQDGKPNPVPTPTPRPGPREGGADD